MKLCINCVHFYVEPRLQFNPVKLDYEEVPGDPVYGLCKRAKRPPSLVTGKVEGSPYFSCHAERQSPCGESARFFQDKNIPVTPEEEEAWQEMDETCPVCKQDTMCLAGNGNYFKCATCGNYRKTQQEAP